MTHVKKSHQFIFIDYLRTFLILLIVAEHISIAYTSLADINRTQCYLSGWLFQDNALPQDAWVILRSLRISVAIPLLFFISGIFIPTSIAKHGPRKFLINRLIRIGGTALFMAIVLAPLTYYLPCKMASPQLSLLDFLQHEFNLGIWRIGPAWFLWTLLIFDGFACFFYCLSPIYFSKLKQVGELFHQYPKLALAGITCLTYLGYILGAYLIAIDSTIFWEILRGPFYFEAIDIFVDALFFILGMILSQYILNTKKSRFKHSYVWLVLSGFIFLIQLYVPVADVASLFSLHYHPKLAINVITTPLLIITLSIGLFALFQNHCNKNNRLATSISNTSYTIFIFHFPICLWLQYFIRNWELSILNKFLLTFLTTISLIMIGFYFSKILIKKIFLSA